METQALSRELKRGSTELLILALLEERRRHGYEIAQLIDERSHGLICFHAASLYPTLYRLEGRCLHLRHRRKERRPRRMPEAADAADVAVTLQQDNPVPTTR
jgi:PadR family transcriptional regulator PadR